MRIKIHKSYRTVIALCDSELLGKKFEEDIYQLHIAESFYNGEEISREEAIKTLRKQAMEDATFNIAGKESIQIGIEAGIINKENVAEINGVPYILVF